MEREKQTIKNNQVAAAKSPGPGAIKKTDEAEETATGKGNMQDAVKADLKNRSKK